MENLNEAGKNFIQKTSAEQIIKVYLALKKLKRERNWGDEYIKLMYKIDPQRFEHLYNSLDTKLREECEREINEQIEAGELDLNAYLVGKYKEERKKEVKRNEGR